MKARLDLARSTVTDRLRASDPPANEPTPTSDYTDLGELGRGGMGIVLRVRDNHLLRDAAMKLLEPTLAADSRYLQGFVAEARIGGQLTHPGIVPVHELGVDGNDRVYFTMPVVGGVSLSAWLRDPARPPAAPERLADALEIFLRICEVVSFAHSRGVIHRDLKPANVMIGEFGEVYVMDWGLALVKGDTIDLGPDGAWTRARMGESTAGTLHYMAPEQLVGRTDAIDERTDVFGLGAVLYEIVTGRPPYLGAEDAKAFDALVRAGNWTPPEEVLGDRRVSGKLLRILRKALAPRPAQRHASVAELRSEVQAFVRRGLYLPRRGFAAGTLIFSEGDPGEEAYLLLKGQCVAFKTLGGSRSELRRMGPGDVFGEMAVLSNAPRTASVQSVDATTVLVISRADMEEGLGLDGWVGALVRSLVSRFRDLDERADGRR